MSILIGVARGVAEDDKRRREMEQEAINKRLKEQQIQQMQESTELNRQREQRYRDTEIARQEELATVRRDAEMARAAEQEQMNNLTGLVAEQIFQEMEREGTPITMEEASRLALLHTEKVWEFETPEPEKIMSVRDQAFLADRNIEAEMADDMDRIIRNRELLNSVSGAQNIVEAQTLTEDYNMQNGTDFSPEAARGVWQDINQSALDPGLDYGDWDSLPSYAQQGVLDEASVLAGSSLVEAEETIATWKAAEADPRMSEMDPYDLAQSIISQKIKKFNGTLPRDLAVLDRILFELERMRVEEREKGDRDDLTSGHVPLNVPDKG
jgi:hypothetical protein